MAKKKEETVEVVDAVVERKIAPVTHEFGNGDMNILRDKINEIIKIIG